MGHLASRKLLAHASILAIVFAAGIAGGSPALSADDVTQERLLDANKEAGNWLHHHKDYSATRFSDLKEINAGNVKNLTRYAAAWRRRGRRHLDSWRP